MSRQLPPPRARTASGHDVPIPESVFVAIAAVQAETRAENQATRAEVAGLREDIASIKQAVKSIAAHNVERWTNLLKVVVPAVVTIVGGVIGANKLSAPATPPPTVVHESALSAELVQCQAKPEAEQRYCVANAYELDKVRRRGGPP